MSKVNYNDFFAVVKDTTSYTKAETVDHIKKLVHTLMDQRFDLIINPDAFAAIRTYLKGNMENHLEKIRFSDILVLNGGTPRSTKSRNEKPAKPIDYAKVLEILHAYLKDGKAASASEIKKEINAKLGVDITTGQWQAFRKKLPMAVGNAKFDIEKIGGDKAQSRWKIKKVK